MKFVQDNIGEGNFVKKYSQGVVHVDGIDYMQPIIITANQIISPWQGANTQKMTPESYQEIFDCKPELVILGTGTTQRFPSAFELQLFIESQIGVECMDTAAACRTFNILLAEGRKVVAGLIP